MRPTTIQQFPNVTIEEQSNGIWIRLTNAGRVELAELRESHPEWNDSQLFFELLSQWGGPIGNGWTNFDASQVPGALTGSPIILSPDCETDDMGGFVSGSLYWHERYAIELACEAMESPSNGVFLLKA